MGWLYRFHLKRALRDRGDMFWSLIFPLVLATLFYASFGSGKDLEQMSIDPDRGSENGRCEYEF